MAKKGSIKIETGNGTEEIPVFETNDVENSAWKVQTETGTGAIRLVDPSNADIPQIKVQTENGVKSVATSLTLTTSISSEFTLNNQNAQLTIYEDVTGNGTADYTETVTLSSGTTSYDLSNLQGGEGNTYWIQVNFDNPEIEKTAEIQQITLNTGDEPIIPNSGSYKFETFDSDVWATYSDASYNSENDYITLTDGSGQNGELEFKSGIGVDSWYCEWDNIFDGGNYEIQQFAFYASGVDTNGIGSRIESLDFAYTIGVNYDGDIYLREWNNGSNTVLDSSSTSTSTHTYRLEYENGTVKFYVDGDQKINYSIDSPNSSNTVAFFKSSSGRYSTTNHIDNVTIDTL